MTAIPDAFARFAGWTYGYPVAVPPGMAAPTGDPARDRLPGVPDSVPVAYEPSERRTVCTGLTAWCVLAAFPELREDPDLWGAINVWDPTRPWSPIEALVAHGFAEETPGRWPLGVYLTQSWRALPDLAAGGHSRLVWVEPEGLVVREASRTAGRVREVSLSAEAWRRWGAETRAVRLG